MRLWRSFSFRLVLLYAGLFTLSVSLLMGLYYWSSIYQPMEEVRDGLRDDSARLIEIYEGGGAARLAPLLERRAATDAPRRAYHALIDARGNVVTTNLPSWPDGADTPRSPDSSSQRWLRIEADIYRDGDEDDHEALILDQRLRDGGRLMIGRDINDLDDLEEAILETGIWLPPVILLLALLGGALMSRAIGRRIEAMSATALRVMEGDLSGRVPVRGSADDFDRLGGTLNAMLDRIEVSLDSVRRVSDSVAHELRTPLSRFRADLAELKTAPPERAAELTERVSAEAERLSRIFDAVLRISRIEARRHDAKLGPTNLSAIVEDAVDYHAPQIEEHELRLETEIAPGLTIEGDRDLLFQAISNLIDNAVKFTPAKGRIAIKAAVANGSVELVVEDDGVGLAPELISRAGERFFRAPSASATPGFGLGLALAKAVAALHDSRLELSDAEPGLRAVWLFKPG